MSPKVRLVVEHWRVVWLLPVDRNRLVAVRQKQRSTDFLDLYFYQPAYFSNVFLCFKPLQTEMRPSRRFCSFLTTLLLAGATTSPLLTAAQPTLPAWNWAAAGGSTEDDESTAIAVDAAGNTYVTGYYSGATAQFGADTLTSQGGTDIFVAKYDPSGALLWLRGGGSTQDDEGLGIAIDPVRGYCYVSGTIRGDATFDTQSVGNILAETAVMLCYDDAGNLRWFRSPINNPRGTGSSRGGGVAIDGSGNAYTVGAFTGHIAFGVTQLDSFGNDPATDAYVVAYEPNAAPRLVMRFGGVESEEATHIGVDAASNYYVSGIFGPSTTIGSTTLTATGSKDGFVAKFNNAGVAQWAHGYGGSNAETLPYAIAVSADGDCYVVGDSDAPTVVFGNAQATNSSTGGYMGYAAHYSAGGAVRWVLAASSNENAGIYGVGLRNNVVHLTGGFAGTVAFDNSVASPPPSLTTTTPASIFVVRCDSATGQPLTTTQAGSPRGSDPAIGQALAVDDLGTSHVTGYFAAQSPGAQVQFGALPVLTARGVGDVFVATLSAGPLATPNALADVSFRVFPNPVVPAARLTVEGLLAAPARLTLLDALGRPVQTTTTVVANGTANWALAAVPAGLYTLRAEQAGTVRVRRVVVK